MSQHVRIKVTERLWLLCRSKVSFACSEEQIKAALEPHVAGDLLYASLGGTKPDDSYSLERLDTLMRSLDKVYILLCMYLPAASLTASRR